VLRLRVPFGHELIDKVGSVACDAVDETLESRDHRASRLEDN
jgi:hypothetical protein